MHDLHTPSTALLGVSVQDLYLFSCLDSPHRALVVESAEHNAVVLLQMGLTIGVAPVSWPK